MKVDVLRKKMVRPAHGAILDRVGKLKLSCIDRLQFPGYGPFVFFFNATGLTREWMLSEGVDRLEKSLSEVLTLFYPLAGRYCEEDSLVRCNDEGVEFVVTTVDAELGQLLRQRFNPEMIRGLSIYRSNLAGDSPLVAIQVNVFECGGLAINISVSHLMGDMQAISMFMNSWAVASRDGVRRVTVHPDFNSSVRFPSLEGMRVRVPPPKTGKKFVMHMFRFDEGSLRNDFGASRVVMVSALISTAILNSVDRARNRQLPHSFSVVHSINLRGKTGSPIATDYFGNMVTHAVIRSTVSNDAALELSRMADLIRIGLSDARGKYSKVTSDEEICSMVVKDREDMFRDSGSRLVLFSSWCRFPLYENDFGWGKPEMVTSISMPFRVAYLMDRKSDKGIDALISLSEDDMMLFKRDPNIISSSLF
ncbi:hypothetical protein MLD38_032388 [Melastoma candidum]|uniref:Uncharacterized protein n=1 Tax=Melastoma candidum TaxID=119954 RepID=A0ACB9M5W8_9MYRT|nr:hypothetical protein MLD38_032388 [Melastoma candidum]